MERNIVNKAGKITGIRYLFNKVSPNTFNCHLKLDFIRIFWSGDALGPAFTPTFNYFRDSAGMGHNSLILLILKVKGLSLQ